MLLVREFAGYEERGGTAFHRLGPSVRDVLCLGECCGLGRNGCPGHIRSQVVPQRLHKARDGFIEVLVRGFIGGEFADAQRERA